jgi:two-component system copper resistance phosphate regulon response regulator CusR
MKILLVEDEPKVAAFMKQGLEEEGFEIDVVFDGQMGKKFALMNNYDLIILDLIIPYINGVDLCRQIKEKKFDIPVMMTTALGTLDDKITGFDAGADDYLVKPFEFKELIARIYALGRRNKGAFHTSNAIRVADIELDLDNKSVVRGGKKIDLTAKEYALLELFMRNYGRLLSRDQIAEKVWEINFDRGTNVVDVYINILRKKIDRDFPVKMIHTRVGMGYIFKEE